MARWLIISVVFLLLLLLFFIEYPAVILKLVKAPLKEQGIIYGEVKGSLLSGFEIYDVNYQDNIQAKKVGLKVDFEQLEKRVLHIKELELNNLTVDKTYLSSLIDTSSSKEKSDSNSSLPFDTIIVDRADISLNNIEYNEYFLKSAKFKVSNLKSDLKQQYIGDIYLLLDSNVTDLDLNASVDNKNVNILVKLEPKNHFLHTFTKDYNLTFISNPIFKLKAKGHIENQIEYKLTTHRLELNQNEYQIDSQKLLLLGKYNIATKELINHIDTQLEGDIAKLSLVADTTLNLNDINNSLKYRADLNTTIGSLFLNNILVEQNLTFLESPKIELKSAGDLEYLTYNLKGSRLTLKQNEYEVRDAIVKTKGDYSVLYKDVTTTINAKLDSNIAEPISLDLNAKFNIDDINTTLAYQADLNTTIKKEFLNRILVEQNLTFLASPKIELKSAGNFENLTYKLRANSLNLKYNEFRLNEGEFLTHGEYGLLSKDVTTVIDTTLKSNVAEPIVIDLEAKLNLDNINSTLEYSITFNSTVKKEFLNSTLKSRLAEQNLTFLASPKIELKSVGNFENLTYNLKANNLNLKYNEYILYRGEFLTHGDYSILHKDVTTIIDTTLDTNLAAPIKLDLDAKFNTKDINTTLLYSFKANITPNKEFIQSKIPDNLFIKKVAPLDILAKGSLLETTFELNLNHLSAQREDIDAEIKTLKLTGESNILEGYTHANISTSFNSTVGEGKIEDDVTLNFNDLKNTLKYKAKIEIDASAPYLNKILKGKEKNIEITDSPKIKLILDGGMSQLTLQLDSQANIIKDKKLSKIDIKSSPIVLNLKEHTIEGKLKIINDSDNLGLTSDINFSGDYTKPKNLKINSDIQIKSFNAFGIDLNSLAPISIKVENGAEGATFIISSKRLNLRVTSSDQDHFNFEIQTGKLYLYKIIELPEALDHKFVKINARGEVTLSTQQLELYGDLYSNKKFHAKIDATNGKSGLNATLKTKYLFLQARGDIESKKIEVKLTTNSLNELQNELYALYEFEKVAIDGAIAVEAKLDGEDIHANITTQQLMFDGFNIEELELDSIYAKELVTINKLNFKTTNFEDKKLNREFYLNQKALIHLGERRDVLIDMHPNILIEMRGDKEYIEGDFKITKLPLGHPSYGSMVLTTDVHYQQEGKRKHITGDIFLKKMKLFYEAKFLDADHDPDVIIITKQDKKKEKSEDNFLENTFISLTIHTPEANYRTHDIDLLFDVEIEANKAFGEELALFGKVEEINGRFDQVPKRFKIVDSNIVFKGGKKINPLLDIHVEYELPQVLININIGGSAERPKIEFSSEPPMPKKDIMSYLLLGVSTANFANGEGSVSREAELFIINQAARDLSYEMEFDRVFIKDDGTGEGYAIEVGKKVSPKNMIIIETSKEGNSLILEHDITKSIKLRVGHHQKENSSQSIDIFFRKRFK